VALARGFTRAGDGGGDIVSPYLAVADRPHPPAEGTRGAAHDGPALVRVDGLVKSFIARRPWLSVLRHPFRHERIEVLRGISLEIKAGEFFGLLGPNGAGKTTLFKILATLILPDAGMVEVAGADAVIDPATVRRVLTPVIADERSLYWRLTGLQNLELFASLYGIEAADQTRVATELLDKVGLTHAANQMVGTYSSGMKQRALIARALLSRPSVLLLDEPTRSLDPVSARDFRRFLRDEVVGRQGCTVILATHDADEALELCDRLAVLDRGRLVAQGTARELAAIAGENRYRLVVAPNHVTDALDIMRLSAHTAFTCCGVSEEGWAVLEGEIRGGAPSCAELMRRLAGDGVSVAQLAQIPLSLADLLERLVERGEHS
jgi:ABC-2 type transport system ATP-binding protein